MNEDDPCDDPVWRQGFAAGYAGALEREKQAQYTGFERGQDDVINLIDEWRMDGTLGAGAEDVLMGVLMRLRAYQESK